MSKNIWYHGSDTKIEKFSDEFVGGKEATDQEGPGIYFSNTIDDAYAYGNYIYTVKLSPRKVVPLKGPNISEDVLAKLIRTNPQWEDSAMNWAEDPEDGIYVGIDSILRYYPKKPHEQLKQTWYDFFRWEPQYFVRGVVALGYDAVVTPPMHNQIKGRYHCIVYNPSIISVENIENRELSESEIARLKTLAGII